jgi:antitoxin (DNA-binding transcriptional repressor) of toxin-antitoxin stability system
MNLHEAKAQLSKVVRLVKAGDTVILCERNRPVAEIRALPGVGKPKKRRLGQMKDLCPVGAEFFQADAEIASLINDEPIIPPTGQPPAHG